VAFPPRVFGSIFLLLVFLFPVFVRADVTGTVVLKGTPNSHDESFYARANGCGESPIRHTENWKVGQKGELADVVVWIVDPKFEAPTAVNRPALPVSEVAIKQIGCRYVPHVIAVQAGIPFKIINGDATLHNIRAKTFVGPNLPPGDDVFNFGQSYQGQTDERQFDTPGIYSLQCDVHSWMQAWVRVVDNYCFAVSDEKGAFTIQQPVGIADGDYKIEAWHPKFAATLEQTVHVKNGVGVTNFVFEGPKSF